MTTTHCFTKSDKKPRSGKECFSGDSSKVSAVQFHLKEHLIFLAFSLTGDVFEIRSPDICYSRVFISATVVDNEHFFQVRHPRGVEYKLQTLYIYICIYIIQSDNFILNYVLKSCLLHIFYAIFLDNKLPMCYNTLSIHDTTIYRTGLF
jgi:hypothetical protein